MAAGGSRESRTVVQMKAVRLASSPGTQTAQADAPDEELRSVELTDPDTELREDARRGARVARYERSPDAARAVRQGRKHERTVRNRLVAGNVDFRPRD